MSAIPMSGPATLHLADPPRHVEVEFTDGRRSLRLPIRAAIPVLTRALGRAGVHPSVSLLGGGALLAMQEVAAGRIRPGSGTWEPLWESAELVERIDLLAAARASPECPVADASRLIKSILA
ncbi:MAG: ATP-dependent helicase, partial [Nocardioides sp.]